MGRQQGLFESISSSRATISRRIKSHANVDSSSCMNTWILVEDAMLIASYSLARIIGYNLLLWILGPIDGELLWWQLSNCILAAYSTCTGRFQHSRASHPSLPLASVLVNLAINQSR